MFLPLHIFEPRYREMVADALASDRMIGMVLLRPGWERDYEGRPPVYPIGCSGVITHVERLADGRYNIVLRGLERFRIVDEDHAAATGARMVEPLPERGARPPTIARDPAASALEARGAARAGDRTAARQRGRQGEIADPTMPSAMADEDLVNALAQYLDLEPLEKQALLEKQCLRTRAESLVELLEMKIMMARTPGLSNVAH